MEIKKELIESVKLFLDRDGVEFFRTCKVGHGSISPVLIEQSGDTIIYHPVHFNQGTQVRKFMKASGFCEDWREEDFFQNWIMIVAAAIE